MTAEIALMNKEAIALAADSAVTMQTRSVSKIFSSANKIFMLSKYRPVGIMIYEDATFMGIPWEILIKTYRDLLGEKSFPTLEEYAKNFIEFLDKKNSLFPAKLQKDFLKGSIDLYFEFLNEQLFREIESILKEKGILEEGEEDKIITGIITSIIKEQCSIWENGKQIPNISDNFEKNFADKFDKLIDKSLANKFENILLSQEQKNQLKRLAVLSNCRYSNRMRSPTYSGVVIAGFGEKDIFPSLVSYIIELVINNRLKYNNFGTTKITYDSGAAIIPFAQREMVTTFMEGIDPDYMKIKDSYISQIFKKYPEMIVSHIKGYSESDKIELENKLKEVGNELLNDLKKKLSKYRTEHYSMPIINVVAGLPKDELAKMAESLISLTSFKRRVSPVNETVSGPIDVALISKGDGFIWVKRKHYFTYEMNPQFRDNYYRRCEENGD